MSSFHAHTLSRLSTVLDPAGRGRNAATEWSPSAVSTRVLGRASGYLAARLTGDAPLLVRSASTILTAKGVSARVLLDGEDTRQTFTDLVYGRLLGLLSVHGVLPRSLQTPPAITCNLTRGGWQGKQKLTCDEVDAVLAHLGLPLGAMFAPALGPYDARLLHALGNTRATRGEVEQLLAGYRGEARPSRAVGGKAGGVQLATTGCAGAVRRMVDQDLLEVAEPSAHPLSTVLRVTDAGRRVASRHVTPNTNTNNPG